MRIGARVGWSTVVLGLVLLVLATSTAVALATSWGGWSWASGVVVDVVVGAAALLRPARLLGCAVTGVLTALGAVAATWAFDWPAAPGPAAAVALSVLVGAVTRRSRGLVASELAAGGLIVVLATWVAAFPHTGPTAVTLVNAGCWVAGVLVGLLLRLLDVRREVAAEAIRRDERAKLASELHDVAAHHLVGVILHAQAAELLLHRRSASGCDAALHGLDESLRSIGGAGSEALDAVRRVVGLLRTHEGLSSVVTAPEELGHLIARFNERHPDRTARLHLSGQGPPWPADVTTTVHRIVQESLTNVSLHAPRARSVDVRVVQTEAAVTVVVVDDGAGEVRTSGRDGYGLLGMRERAEALGGSLEVSAGKSGWSVQATLPTGQPVHR